MQRPSGHWMPRCASLGVGLLCVLRSPLGAHLSQRQCSTTASGWAAETLGLGISQSAWFSSTHLVASHCVTPCVCLCAMITAGTRGVAHPEGPHRAAALGLAAQLQLPQLRPGAICHCQQHTRRRIASARPSSSQGGRCLAGQQGRATHQGLGWCAERGWGPPEPGGEPQNVSLLRHVQGELATGHLVRIAVAAVCQGETGRERRCLMVRCRDTALN